MENSTEPTAWEIDLHASRHRAVRNLDIEIRELNAKLDKDVFIRGRMMMAGCEARNYNCKIDNLEEKYPGYFEKQEQTNFDNMQSKCCSAPITVGIRCSKCQENV